MKKTSQKKINILKIRSLSLKKRSKISTFGLPCVDPVLINLALKKSRKND